MTILSWIEERKQKHKKKVVQKYIQDIARKYLKESEGEPEHHMHRVRTSSLRMMCKEILERK